MRRTAFVVAFVWALSGLAFPRQMAQASSLATPLQELHLVINQYRAANGLPTVTLSPTLTAAAQWMSGSMATYDYFAHASSDGRSPQQRMADAGYPAYATWTGEDIAAGYASASAVLEGWRNSPTHDAVLRNPNYRAIGLGYTYSGASTYGSYWVADFGGILDQAFTVTATSDTAYHAAWALQSAYPVLGPGEVAQLVIAFRNTGSRGWLRGVPGQQANLGTNWPTDRTYPELAWQWPSANRLAVQTTDYVAPGQLGWFSFSIRAPSAPGRYVLAVRPVVDGTAWLEDVGAYWVITVR